MSKLRLQTYNLLKFRKCPNICVKKLTFIECYLDKATEQTL